jgi:hypothetical protein
MSLIKTQKAKQHSLISYYYIIRLEFFVFSSASSHFLGDGEKIYNKKRNTKRLKDLEKLLKNMVGIENKIKLKFFSTNFFNDVFEEVFLEFSRFLAGN